MTPGGPAGGDCTPLWRARKEMLIWGEGTDTTCASGVRRQRLAMLGGIILLPPAPQGTKPCSELPASQCFNRNGGSGLGQPRTIHIPCSNRTAQRKRPCGHMVILGQRIRSRQCLSPNGEHRGCWGAISSRIRFAGMRPWKGLQITQASSAS